MTGSSADSGTRFKADIKKLKSGDRAFAEGIFKHHCPRGRREKKLPIEACRKAIEECKRKITIPPSAVSMLTDIFNDVSGGSDTIDMNGFLAVLSRMIHDSDASRRHRQRRLTSGEGLNIQETMSAIGKGIGTFLGVLDTGEEDASLEIFRERERRLAKRRMTDRRGAKKNAGTRKSMRASIKGRAQGILHLPGTSLFEADDDEDPEECPLDTELDVLAEEGRDNNGAFLQTTEEPPSQAQSGAPPLPPSRQTKFVDCPPSLPDRQDNGGSGDVPPPLPNRAMAGEAGDAPPPLPNRPDRGVRFGGNSDSPALPPRRKDDSAPPLPARDLPSEAENYDFIESREEALEYYRRRATKERVGTIRKQKKSKAAVEDEAWKNARSKTMKQKIREKFLKKKADSLPVFSPWMIYLITYVQIILVAVLVFNGDFAPIKFIPVSQTRNISTLASESGLEEVTSFQEANFWIGPKALKLIRNGATLGSCIRRDNAINQRYRKIRDIDGQSRQGCCVKQVDRVNKAIYTNERKCTSLYGDAAFHNEPCSALRHKIVLAVDHSACCTGFGGHCQLLTRADCSSVGGTYFTNKTCFQVNCLQGICGFTGLSGTEQEPYTPAGSNQFWRFFTSLFIHHGCIHVLLLGAVQVYVGCRIERSAGWLRLFLIYFVCGMMSNIAAAFADPYTIITGGSGALCGLVGVLFVELFNMWSVVKEPVNELINLCIFFAVILLVGTMPHLNNWAHVAGFVFGLLMAMLLLPYVSFGKWGIRRKRILVVVSIILLLVFILSLILLFQIVQNTSCASCDRFNCIDYSPGLCARYRPTPPATAVQYSPNEARYYQNAI